MLMSESAQVLKSIYEGDPMYSSEDPTRHCYKLGEHGESKSFILEIKWSPTYPTDAPQIILSRWGRGGFTKTLQNYRKCFNILIICQI